MDSKPKRSRKPSGKGAVDQELQAQFAQLEGADEESAALIKALLVQDQLDARSAYVDPYMDDAADDIPAKPRRQRKSEPKNDEEMDDDFIPASVHRELKLRGLVPGVKKSRKRKDADEPTRPAVSSEQSVSSNTPATTQIQSDDAPVGTPSKRPKLVAATSTADAPAQTALVADKMDVDAPPNGTTSAISAPVCSNSASHVEVSPKPDAVPATAAPSPGKKIKEPKEKDPRFKDGKWTDDEEQRFMESLERFGRDWDAVANHIATRDKNAIRSHAQKFFIKLYRERKPLPTKVAESGMGYTLSGKPLDPDSAAAKQYLGKSFFNKRLDNLRNSVKEDIPFDNFNGERDSPLPEKTLEEVLASQAADEKAAAAAADSTDATEQKKKPKGRPKKTDDNAAEPFADGAASPLPANSNKKSGKKSAQKKKPFRETDLGIDIGQLLYGDSQENFRVKERLRDRVAISWKQLPVDQDRDPLTLIKPAKYSSTAAQPFKLQVHSNVLLVADLHAHLARVEIIGFLAGQWDAASSTITIKEAYPCRSLSTGEDEVNVEMDPESELEVRKQIEQNQLRVVGWYHSHPNFPPHPSIRDIENQNAYQKLFVDESNRKEPFVGAIVGTYDARMPTSDSIISWFHVDSVEAKGQPYSVGYDIIDDGSVTADVSSVLDKLISFYSTFNDRTHFHERWRFNLNEEQRAALAERKRAALAAATPTELPSPSEPVANDVKPLVEGSLEDQEIQLVGMQPVSSATKETASTPSDDQTAPSATKPDPAELVALAQSAQVTRLQKMLESVRTRLPQSMSIDDSTIFIEKLRASIDACWFKAPISKGDKHHC